MPVYDLRCKQCKQEFNIRSSIADRTENRIPCPECGAFDMEAVFKSALFYVNDNSKPKAGCPNASGCGAAHCRLRDA